MIGDLMPAGVVVAETSEQLLDVPLFAEEEVSLGQPVEKRRREFVTGRACARQALERLGHEPAAVVTGERGEPVWPDGVVGSITHCPGYAACAVARAGEVCAIGIDAEVDAPLPSGVLEAVASARERARLGGTRGGVCLDRVLFSAKESVYKAWFPLARRGLGFEDVDLTIDVDRATFCARLLVVGPEVAGRRLTELRGRWQVAGGVIGTAVVVGVR